MSQFASQFASQLVAVRREPQERWRRSCVAVCGGVPPYPYRLRSALGRVCGPIPHRARVSGGEVVKNEPDTRASERAEAAKLHPARHVHHIRGMLPNKPPVARDLTEAGRYVQYAVLFSVSGRWPMSKDERARLYYTDPTKRGVRVGKGNAKLRRDWGTLPAPRPPPATLSDQQAATVNRLIADRGWQLVRNRKGVWHPQRTL